MEGVVTPSDNDNDIPPQSTTGVEGRGDLQIPPLCLAWRAVASHTFAKCFSVTTQETRLGQRGAYIRNTPCPMDFTTLSSMITKGEVNNPIQLQYYFHLIYTNAYQFAVTEPAYQSMARLLDQFTTEKMKECFPLLAHKFHESHESPPPPTLMVEQKTSCWHTIQQQVEEHCLAVVDKVIQHLSYDEAFRVYWKRTFGDDKIIRTVLASYVKHHLTW